MIRKIERTWAMGILVVIAYIIASKSITEHYIEKFKK